MLCPHCHGSGWLAALDDRGPRPCEACGQLGTLHCCEGEREQPDPDPGDVWQEWQDEGQDHD